ncbi:MAG: hypothetical protein SF123_12360 [Chloroflexota bacterium]|nr:hypothetical protein [Chloroflexota bacterium]
MRKAILITLVLLFMAAAALAQDVNQPDYEVRVVNRTVSVDGTVLILQFGVYNRGDAADVDATANLYIETGGERLLQSQIVAPLGGQGDTQILTFEVPLASIPEGNVDFRLEVGIGEVEAANAANIENNIARLGYLVPTPAAPRQLITPTAPVIAPTQPGIVATPVAPVPDGDAQSSQPDLWTAIRNLDFSNLDLSSIDLSSLDVTNPLVVALVIAACGAGLILLWVLTVILRLIFRPPKNKFEVWQPPYAAIPPQDPNTLSGRRQLWQHSAQSDTMSVPCIEGQYHIRKQLVGLDGRNLSSWRVGGLRLSQYDIYGRVARSQTLAPKSLVNRLDKAARKAATLSESEIEKRVRPIARTLASRFVKNVHRRSAMLPVACDILFRGTHGEVRILFELYQCTNGSMKQIDRWEPEMKDVPRTFQDNYTYTLMGMRQDEKRGAFQKRLEADLRATLKAMLHKPSAPPPAPLEVPVSPAVEVTSVAPSASPTGTTPVVEGGTPPPTSS